MKKYMASFFTLALCVTATFASDSDIEIIELQSVATPKKQQVEIPAPTSQQMAKARLEAEKLIENSIYTLREFENNPQYDNALTKSFSKARGILVFPNVLKAGFFVGVSGGKGVLFARSRTGEWSYPTFYSLNQASAGLQFGINNSQIVMVIMTGKGLGSLIKDNIKIGGDVTSSFGSKGGGKGLATTSNFRRDIKTYTLSKGLFLGVSLNGADIAPDNLMNQAYYGPGATTQTVIIQGQYSNKHADPFRKYLTRFKHTY